MQRLLRVSSILKFYVTNESLFLKTVHSQAQGLGFPLINRLIKIYLVILTTASLGKVKAQKLFSSQRSGLVHAGLQTSSCCVISFSRTTSLAKRRKCCYPVSLDTCTIYFKTSEPDKQAALRPVLWGGSVCHAGRVSYHAKSQHSEELGALQKAISQISYCFK